MMKFGPGHQKWDMITAQIDAQITTFLPLGAVETTDTQKRELAERARALMAAADRKKHPLLASNSDLSNLLQNPLHIVAAEDDITSDDETAFAIYEYTCKKIYEQLNGYRGKKNHESNPHHIVELNEPWIRARKDSWLTKAESQQQRFDAIKVGNIEPYVESLIKPNADAPLDGPMVAKLMKLFEADYDETDEKNADLSEINQVLCQPYNLYQTHIKSGNLQYNQTTYNNSRAAVFDKILDELKAYHVANKDKDEPNEPEGFGDEWLAKQRGKLPELVARTPYTAAPADVLPAEVTPVVDVPVPVEARPLIHIPAYESPVVPVYDEVDESVSEFSFMSAYSHTSRAPFSFPMRFVPLTPCFSVMPDRAEVAQNVSNILMALALLQILAAVSQQQQVMSFGGATRSSHFLVDGPTVTEYDDADDLSTVITTHRSSPQPSVTATSSWKKATAPDCRSLAEISGKAPVPGAPTHTPGSTPRTAPVCRL